MPKELKVYKVHVFVDFNGKYGNPLGIVIDKQKRLNSIERQAITKKQGYSETVFINDIGTGNVRIFNPQKEVSFAGHALVGVAWFIKKEFKKPLNFLTCRGESIFTWQENGLTWIRGKLAITPPWNHEQLKNAYAVENLSGIQAASKKHTIVWAWLDKNKGTIRARTFASDWGIPEDEANGSGAMQLAARLRCNLEIIHGKGSVIYSQPFKSGLVEVGGLVMENP